MAVGSIHATDNSSSEAIDDSDDDFELDEDLEDFELDDYLDDSDDEDLDDSELDDYLDDSDDEDLDDSELDDYLDDSDDEDLDDSELDEDEDNLDDGWSDYLKSYDYLEYKIISYLERYGNCSEDNWTESESFHDEYQIYLANSSDYTLNESAEGYNTYLKIFDSITSTFGDYNLTNNQTMFLKFLIIYYLNNYGNVSANYTWNESESFENYTPPFDFMADAMYDCIAGNAAAGGSGYYSVVYAPLTFIQSNNLTDVNQTSHINQTITEAQNSRDLNIFVLILVLVLMILMFI